MVMPALGCGEVSWPLGKACGRAQGSSTSTVSNQKAFTPQGSPAYRSESHGLHHHWGRPPVRPTVQSLGWVLGPPLPEAPTDLKGLLRLRCPLLEKKASTWTVPPEARPVLPAFPTGTPKPGGVCSLCPPTNLARSQREPRRLGAPPKDGVRKAQPTRWRRAGGGCGRWVSWRLQVPARAVGWGVMRRRTAATAPRACASTEDTARPKLSGLVYSPRLILPVCFKGNVDPPTEGGCGF